MKKITYLQAMREAVRLEMIRDTNVFIAGQDVGVMGSSFGQTAKLLQEFGPQRVVDTPISETATVSLAVGAAALGLRPLITMEFMDFMAVCMDEIINQAAKMRYMLGGKTKIPMVIETLCGGGSSAGAQHSQCLEALFTHIPGLKTITASTPADAKGLMASAIRDDNPVIFIGHRGLLANSGEVPEGEYIIPLGKADIKRSGSDVTIVTWSAMVQKSLAAAELLAKEGIGVEVIDLRSLIPLDKECFLNSMGKTGRLVIVHEAVGTGGFGAEIAAIACDEGFDLLDAPIKRVTAPFTPVPFNSNMEKEYLVNEDKIFQAVKSLYE